MPRGRRYYTFETAGTIDGTKASSWFDGYRVSFTQAGASQDVYRRVEWGDDGSETVTIPIRYFANAGAAAQRADIVVAYDAKGSELSRVFVVGNERRARVALPPGASFRALAMVSKNGAWDYDAVGPTFVTSSPFGVTWTPLAKSAHVAMELDAYNADGAEAAASARVTW